MKLPRKVIGCFIGYSGKEVCTNCYGEHFDSAKCNEIREGEDYQLTHERSDIEQVTVFMTICSGVIDKLLVLDTPELADEHTKRFLEDYGYSDIDEYATYEMSGHLKTEFKIYTREVQYQMEG